MGKTKTVIPFYKMEGGGNDFVVFDNRKQSIPLDYSALAKKVCERKFSVGGDGILALEKTEGADFRMVYYNADGSRAEMCGNGARCIARFAHLHKAAASKMNFMTDAGLLSAEITGDTVRLRMSQPKDLRLDFSLKSDDKDLTASFVNTGVPHAVVWVTDPERVDVQVLGKTVRYHREFSPAGTNANFVQVKDKHQLVVRTYERGVEGETLACGTGCTAAALVAAAQGLAESPVECLTRGGDVLTIHFEMQKSGANAQFSWVDLEGPAKVCFQGEIEI